METQEEGRHLETAAELAGDPKDRFTLLDMLDELQFLQEAGGAVVETFIYEVEQWDPKVKGKVKRYQLSKTGVDAACSALADQHEYVRELDITHQIDRQAQEAFFQARAARFRRTAEGEEVMLETVHGVKRQPMYYVIAGGQRAGEHIDNPHWYEHGVMKACRNARRRLLPEHLVVKLIEQWRKDPKRSQQIDTTTTTRRREAAAAAAAPREEAVAAEPAKTERTDAPRGRKEILDRIASELETHFGEGEPAKVPQKAKVLRTIFKTADWQSLTNMPEARFLQLWDYSRFCDALVLAVEEG